MFIRLEDSFHEERSVAFWFFLFYFLQIVLHFIFMTHTKVLLGVHLAS